MTSVPLEVSVTDFTKGVDDIFERKLKLLEELREAFRAITIALQQFSNEKELPPLEELGVNYDYFNRKASKADTCTEKLSTPSRSKLTLSAGNRLSIQI
ncbi:hypothetical protein D3C73_733310 [compost metagenome]